MQESSRPFAAFIGIDWADKKHDICLVVAGGDKRERSVIEHRPAVLRSWAESLRERFGAAPIAVWVEVTQGPIVSALLEHDFLVLFPVQPTTLARYRNAFTPSRAKDDPTNAEFALELLLRHPEKLARLEQESTPMRTLRRLVETRRALVDDRVRITNRLIAALKATSLRWSAGFATRNPRSSLISSSAGPLSSSLSALGIKRSRDFFRSHNVRYQRAIAPRIAAIRSEQPLTTDQSVLFPMRLLVEALLPQLRAANAAVERFDDEITRLGPQLPDYGLFRSLQGAGATLAPRLLVAFGERRECYPNAAALQKYSGIAPVTERSGNKSWIHWRYSCPKFLRQTFIEWVAQTIPRSFWARAFYQSCRARGMRHQAALRALPFKWIRVLYRCWVDRTHYDEARYLLALQTAGSTPSLRCRASELVFIDGPPQGVSSAAGPAIASDSIVAVSDPISTRAKAPSLHAPSDCAGLSRFTPRNPFPLLQRVAAASAPDSPETPS